MIKWQELKATGGSHSFTDTYTEPPYLVGAGVVTVESTAERPISTIFYPDPEHEWDGSSSC
jgi:hypothetical protein